MAKLLKDCETFVLPYSDDIAIYSEAWKDHIKDLSFVLDRINKVNLRLKSSKYTFAQKYVKHLGYIVGQGLRTCEGIKVQTIKDYPPPKTKTEVRAFLILKGYYKQYILLCSL
ncbi:retrovirus-related Pol polyprotein from transposon 17.6 [Caerostris extrusa]|uniref:Retrovirus-related Pol polyprotein from transposon 17.6 n=1 Tax=Caerostris extrusa TaxID=172846 RepID=A0AAV4UZU8_CAEEX|nr:retrovirus-related Pol polyprotein from transposon 17.6 [Caerostris extrusa]